MSQTSTAGGRLSPDDRYELAQRAQDQQRLNYPKHLIGVGSILVFASVVTLAIAWQSRASAIKSNELQAYKLAAIEQLITEIQTLEAVQANSQSQDQGQPISDILSKFKRFGTQSKLVHDVGLPINPGKQRQGNVTLMTYPYNLRDPSLERLLNWVRTSIDQIPGLGVSSIDLKPGKQEWTMSVTLSRYQRNE